MNSTHSSATSGSKIVCDAIFMTGGDQYLFICPTG